MMASEKDLENIKKFVEQKLIEMYEAMKLLNTYRQKWIEEIKVAILLDKRREQAEKERQEFNKQFEIKPTLEKKKDKEQELPTIASVMAQLTEVVENVKKDLVAKVTKRVKELGLSLEGSNSIINTTAKAFDPESVLSQAAKLDGDFSKAKNATEGIVGHLDQAPQFMHQDLRTSAESVMQTNRSSSSVFTLAAMTNFAKNAYASMCKAMERDPATTKPHEVSAEAAQKVAQEKKEIMHEKRQVAEASAPALKKAKEEAEKSQTETKNQVAANTKTYKDNPQFKDKNQQTPEFKESVKLAREANKAAKKDKKKAGKARQPQVEAYRAADAVKKAEKNAKQVGELEKGFKASWEDVKEASTELGDKAGNVFDKCRVAVESLRNKVAEHFSKKDEVKTSAEPTPKLGS